MKKNSNNAKGITLITLVITIIVLLILAGITIGAITGENGLIGNAGKAKEETEIAEEKKIVEKATVQAMGNNSMGNILKDKLQEWLDKLIGDGKVDIICNGDMLLVKFIEKDRYYEVDNNGNIEFVIKVVAGERVPDDSNAIYMDGENIVMVPAGFTVSNIEGEKEIDKGLVIYDIPKETTINWNDENIKKEYNQFVWIPVENPDEFIRYEGYSNKYQNMLNICSEPYKNSDSTETQDYNTMLKSVTDNRGFYVARYEASKNNETGLAESKESSNVWTYIKWGNSMNEIGTEGAVYHSQQMYKNDSREIKSTLIYGVQWDAIMVWIDSNYKIENGCNTSTSLVANTDIKEVIKNIYNLSGGVQEWTMEAYGTNGRVYRGNSRVTDSYTVSSRNAVPPSSTIATLGFRVVLIL